MAGELIIMIIGDTMKVAELHERFQAVNPDDLPNREVLTSRLVGGVDGVSALCWCKEPDGSYIDGLHGHRVLYLAKIASQAIEAWRRYAYESLRMVSIAPEDLEQVLLFEDEE